MEELVCENDKAKQQAHALESEVELSEDKISVVDNELTSSKGSECVSDTKHGVTSKELKKSHTCENCVKCCESGKSMTVALEKTIHTLQVQNLKLEKKLAYLQSEIVERGNTATSYKIALDGTQYQLQLSKQDCVNKTSLMKIAQLDCSQANEQLELMIARYEMLQNMVQELKITIATLDPTLGNLICNDHGSFEEALKKYVKSQAELQMKFDHLTREKEDTDNKLKELMEKNYSLSSDNEKMKFDVQTLKAELESNLKRLFDAKDASKNLKMEYDILRNKKETLELEKQTLTEEVSTLKKDVIVKEEEYSNYMANAEEKVKSVRSEFDFVSKNLELREKSLLELQHEKDWLVQRESKLTQQLHALDLEYKGMKYQKEKEVNELQRSLDEAKDCNAFHETTISKTADDLAKCQAELAHNVQVIKAKDEEIQHWKTTYEQNMESLKAELHHYATDRQDLLIQNETLISRVENSLRIHNSDEVEIKKLLEKIQKLTHENALLITERATRNTNIENLSNHRDVLDEMKNGWSKISSDWESLYRKGKQEIKNLKEAAERNKKQMATLEENNSFFTACILDIENEVLDLARHISLVQVTYGHHAKKQYLVEKLNSLAEKVVECEQQIKLAEACAARTITERPREVHVMQTNFPIDKGLLRAIMERLTTENQEISEGDKDLLVSIDKVNNEVLQLRSANSALVQETTALTSQQDKLITEILRLRGKLMTKAALQDDQLIIEQVENSMPPLVVPECTDVDYALLKVQNAKLSQKIILIEAETNRVKLQLSSLSAAEKRAVGNEIKNLKQQLHDLQRKLDDSERQLRLAQDGIEKAEIEHFVRVTRMERKFDVFKRSCSCLGGIENLQNSVNENRGTFLQKSVLEKKDWTSIDSGLAISNLRKNNEVLKIETEKKTLNKTNLIYERVLMKNRIEAPSARISATVSKQDNVNECGPQTEEIKGKYESAKKADDILEQDRKHSQKQLNVTTGELGGIMRQHIHCSNATNIWDDVQRTKQTNHELQKELQQTKDSIPMFQLQVEDLQTTNPKIKVEESVSQELVNDQSRWMSKEAEFAKYRPSQRRFTLSSSISSPALNSLQELRDSSLQKQTGLKQKEQPHFVRKNTKKSTPCSTITKACFSQNADDNGSIVARGFNNKNAMGGRYFQCDQESPVRVMAKRKRNLLRPPHVHSSYPDEGKIQYGGTITSKDRSLKRRMVKRRRGDSNSSIEQHRTKKSSNAEKKISSCPERKRAPDTFSFTLFDPHL